MEILHKYRFHWLDVAIISLVAVALAVLSVGSFMGRIPSDGYAPWITAALTVFCVVAMVAYAPRYVMITHDLLIVKCNLRTVQIPLRDIASVEPFEGRSLMRKAVRVGMSGAQLTIGKYTIPGLGKVEVITTRKADRVMITTKFGYRLVINCPLDALRNHPYITRLNG